MTDPRATVAAKALKFLKSTGFPYTPEITSDTVESWAESFNGISEETAMAACIECSKNLDHFPALAEFLAFTRLIRRVDASHSVPVESASEHVKALQAPGIAMQRAIRESKKGGTHVHRQEDASHCPICSAARREEAGKECTACEEMEAHGFPRSHHRRLP